MNDSNQKIPYSQIPDVKKHLPAMDFNKIDKAVQEIKANYEQTPIRGKFIVFEGIDGSGKSSQVEAMVRILRMHDLVVEQRAEPTKNTIGRFIREQFLSGKEEVDPRVHNLLFTADRMDHITNPNYGLLNTLNSGVNVICDRYYLSSLAYNRQKGVSLETAMEIQSVNMNLLRPDATIFLDCDPKICLDRINKNRASKEIFETIEKLIETRSRYFDAMNLLKNNETFVIIDSSGSFNDVHWKIFKAIQSILLKK